jgi:hypothetical protein
MIRRGSHEWRTLQGRWVGQRSSPALPAIHVTTSYLQIDSVYICRGLWRNTKSVSIGERLLTPRLVGRTPASSRVSSGLPSAGIVN